MGRDDGNVTNRGGKLRVLDVCPAERAWPAESARSTVLPGIARDIDDGLDPGRFEPVQDMPESSLKDYLPEMGDLAAQQLRDFEIQARELEARKTIALLTYIEEFTARRRWERRAKGVDGRDAVTVVDNHGEVWRYWTEEKQARTDEDAAIMYAAQTLGWSEYRAARLYDNALTSRDELPNLWEWFRDARVSVLAMGKVAQASRKLKLQESIATLNERAPKQAARLRPAELDGWLKRFLAEVEPEEHAARFAEAARQRYVSVRPAEDHDAMSVLTALLPTVTAQAIAGKLRGAARSHIQPVPHNPVIIEPADVAAEPEGLDPQVPAEMAAAGYTVSEDEWLRHQVEEVFAQVGAELPSRQVAAAPPTAYVDGDQRSLAQREADLLCSWLMSAEQVDGLPTETQVGLLVPLQTLTAESDKPGVTRDRSDAVPAPVLRKLVADPDHRIRWHQLGIRHEEVGVQDDLDVLSHSYTGYQVPKVLREAIWFRDGVCQARGCTIAAERGDIDHITRWPPGKTTGSNLQALCRRHHRVKSGGYQVLSDQIQRE